MQAKVADTHAVTVKLYSVGCHCTVASAHAGSACRAIKAHTDRKAQRGQSQPHKCIDNHQHVHELRQAGLLLQFLHVGYCLLDPLLGAKAEKSD